MPSGNMADSCPQARGAQGESAPLAASGDWPGLDLAIETSTRGASLALARGDELWTRALEPGAAHASDLLPLLQRLIEESGQARVDLRRVYVGIGPGSFTGLRVGAAVALGLARALDVELVAVPSVEAVAWAHLKPGETGTVVLDARSGALYAATYTRDEEGLCEWLAPTRWLLPQAPQQTWRPGVLLGDERAAQWLGVEGKSEWTWRADAQPNARDLLWLGRQRYRQHGASALEEVRPLYLAAFGA